LAPYAATASARYRSKVVSRGFEAEIAVAFFAYASVGAPIASRRRENPIGWLFLAAGVERQQLRAQLRVGADSAVIVADVRGDQVAPSGGNATHIIKVRVPDVDAAFARARDAGARVLEEPTTHEYGERSCMLEDASGHRWELTQTVRDVEPEEWGGITVGSW
jgi:uncharacterized glyoxalase superfamily protein PhnB